MNEASNMQQIKSKSLSPEFRRFWSNSHKLLIFLDKFIYETQITSALNSPYFFWHYCRIFQYNHCCPGIDSNLLFLYQTNSSIFEASIWDLFYIAVIITGIALSLHCGDQPNHTKLRYYAIFLILIGFIEIVNQTVGLLNNFIWHSALLSIGVAFGSITFVGYLGSIIMGYLHLRRTTPDWTNVIFLIFPLLYLGNNLIPLINFSGRNWLLEPSLLLVGLSVVFRYLAMSFSII